MFLPWSCFLCWYRFSSSFHFPLPLIFPISCYYISVPYIFSYFIEISLLLIENCVLLFFPHFISHHLPELLQFPLRIGINRDYFLIQSLTIFPKCVLNDALLFRIGSPELPSLSLCYSRWIPGRQEPWAHHRVYVSVFSKKSQFLSEWILNIEGCLQHWRLPISLLQEFALE